MIIGVDRSDGRETVVTGKIVNGIVYIDRIWTVIHGKKPDKSPATEGKG